MMNKKRLLLFALIGTLAFSSVPAVAFAAGSQDNTSITTEAEDNLFNWAQQKLSVDQFDESLAEDNMSFRKDLITQENLDQLLAALKQGVETEEDQEYYNQAEALVNRLKNLHAQLDQLDTALNETTTNQDQQDQVQEDQEQSDPEQQNQEQEQVDQNQQDQEQEQVDQNQQDQEQESPETDKDEQADTDTEDTQTDEQSDLLKGAALEDVSALIKDLDSTTLFIMIDGSVSRGRLQNGEDLKKGITADLITAISIKGLNDPDGATGDTASLQKVLSEQGLDVAEYQEPTNETLENEAEEPVATDGMLKDIDVTEQQEAPAVETTVASTQAKNGTGELSSYLSSLLKEPGSEATTKRNSLLVSQGDKLTSFDKNSLALDPSTHSVNIIKKTAKSFDNQSADMEGILNNTNHVYPGAVIRANQHLMEGNPDEVVQLKRNPVTVFAEGLPGTTEKTINDFKKSSYEKAYKQIIDEFKNTKQTVQTSMQKKEVDVQDSSQLDASIGVSGAAKKFNIDTEAVKKGEKQVRIISLKQIYFSMCTDSADADGVYDDSVTPDQLAKQFNANEGTDKLAGALVTKVNYGRQIYVKFETENKSSKVKAAWDVAINGGKFENKTEYENIMKSTNITMMQCGGSSQTAGKLISCNSIDDVNKILAEDSGYNGNFNVVPVSYTCDWLDEGGSQCMTKRTGEYVETTVEQRSKINFHCSPGSAWCAKHQKLYGRRIIGINKETGELICGAWEKLMDTGDGDKRMELDGDFAELAYGCDVRWGTDWPYSNVFWRASDGPATDVYIGLNGTCRMVSIHIDVNGKQIFRDGNCSKHREWNMNAANNQIRNELTGKENAVKTLVTNTINNAKGGAGITDSVTDGVKKTLNNAKTAGLNIRFSREEISNMKLTDNEVARLGLQVA